MRPRTATITSRRTFSILSFTLPALLLIAPANCASPTQLYVVCKRVNSNLCVYQPWPLDFGPDTNLENQVYRLDDFDRCGLSELNPIPPHRKFIAVNLLSDKPAWFFCNLKKLQTGTGVIPTDDVFPGIKRLRRQASYRLRGRYRGQTQSQYLAIDRGNGKDEGKAEAHSAADSSRAIVSGNSGMGQAQSQTIYDPSCEDCNGRSDTEIESLTRQTKGPTNGQGSNNYPGINNNQNGQGQIPGAPFRGSNGDGSTPNISGDNQNINRQTLPHFLTNQRNPDGNYLTNQPGGPDGLPGDNQNINRQTLPHFLTNQRNPDGNYLTYQPGGPDGLTGLQYGTQPNQLGGNGQLNGGKTSNQPGTFGIQDGSSNQPPQNIINPGVIGSNLPNRPGLINQQKPPNANNQWTNGLPTGNTDMNRIPGNVNEGQAAGPPNIPNGFQQTPSNVYTPQQTGSPNGGMVPNQNTLSSNNGLPTQAFTPSGNNYAGYPGSVTGGGNGATSLGNPFSWPVLSDVLRQRGAGSTYFCCVVGPDNNIQNLFGGNSNILNRQPPYGGASQTPSGQYGGTGQVTAGPYGGSGQVPTGQYGQAPSTQYGATGATGTGQYGGTGQIPAGQYGGTGQGPTGTYGGQTPPSQIGGAGPLPSGQYGGTGQIPAGQFGAGQGPTGSYGGTGQTPGGIGQVPTGQYGGTNQAPGQMGGSGQIPTGQYGGPGQTQTGPIGGTGRIPSGQIGGSGQLSPGQFGGTGQYGGPGHTSTGQYGGPDKIPTSPYGGPGQTPTGQYGGPGQTLTGHYGEPGQVPTGQYGGLGKMPTGQYGGTGQTPTGQYGGTDQTPTNQYGGTGQTPNGQFGGTSQAPTGQFGGTSQIPTGQYGGKSQAPTGQYGGTGQTPSGQFEGPGQTPSGQYGGPSQTTGQYGGPGQTPTGQYGGTGQTSTGQYGGPGNTPTGPPGGPGYLHAGQYGGTGQTPIGQYGGTSQMPTSQYGGVGQITNGQYGGTGQTATGSGQIPTEQYGGPGQIPTGQYGGTGQSPTGQYGGTGQTPTGQYGGTGQTPTGQYGGIGQTPTGQYGGTGQIPSGQYGGSGQAPTGQYGGTGSATTGPSGGTGLIPSGQYGGPGQTPAGQYGGPGQSPTGQYGGSGQTPTGQNRAPGLTPAGQYGVPGQIPSDQFGGSGQTPTGQYGSTGQTGPVISTPGGQYGSAGQTSNGPYGGAGPGGQQTGVINTGQGFSNQGNGNGEISGIGEPQNVVDPNSISSSFDDYDSEAEASVAQAANGTTALASSKGGNEKGRAQTQVEGTYSGTGSFSANAEISDDNKAAQSHVSGSKKGASSSAEGRGRKNKSQASVKLGSETGSILTDSQSSGDMHSSSSQVQGSVKGGMADAQAKGPGSTSSQAQIGFTPYKDEDKEKHDALKAPFEGGGTASAQSSRRMGTSQSQLRGTFKYGISYNGAAQAGSSLDKDAVFSNLLPFDKIDVFDENNKNIDVEVASTEKPYETTLRNTEDIESPSTEKVDTQNTDSTYNQNKENDYSDHLHVDHHKSDSQPNVTTRAPPVGNRRSFQPNYANNGADYEYPVDKDEAPEEYEIDDGFGTDVNENTPVEQSEYANYDDLRDTEPTHQSLQHTNKKPYEIKQTTGGNTQHIILGSLNNHDAKVIQKNSEHPDESRVYQPGEKVPGMGGYTIPAGFTGSVKSVASKDKTYVIGSKYSPSQAQTVSLTPGSGKIKYVYPNNYGKNVNPTELRSLYRPKSNNDNRYVSVSKSVTRDLDSESNIRKQYSHTYYTKSSSCGYFTFSCTMVSSAEGKKKVCKPKIPTNPDGTPMRC